MIGGGRRSVAAVPPPGSGPTAASQPEPPGGALMVCGTTSNAGKTTVVAGLCRLLARAGVRVAPFKAQNMALNSVVTPSGHEIGRAQGLQAAAAGVEPTPEMNPILLKPTHDASCQVVVHGKPIGAMTAAEYHRLTPRLLPLVLESLADLRAGFDVVLCEGAGSPAEINLLDHDIVNLRVAVEADIPAIIVGDIDLGGVFAALYGTLALLPEHYSRLVHGFVINKFRGDPALLLDGCAQLQTRTGVPTLGILPYLDGLALDAEDSLSLRPDAGGAPGGIDVAVVRLPRIANFTDLDPLRCEPGVSVRFVETPAALGRPDLVVLPGTKSTVGDLAVVARRWGSTRRSTRRTRRCSGSAAATRCWAAPLRTTSSPRRDWYPPWGCCPWRRASRTTRSPVDAAARALAIPSRATASTTAGCGWTGVSRSSRSRAQSTGSP